jgi:hypothetical protein
MFQQAKMADRKSYTQSKFVPILRRIKILIATDSRGSGISNQINRNQNLASLKNVKIDIRILPGAKLDELHRAVNSASVYQNYDLIIIVGGICNLTEKSVWGNLNILDYPVKDLYIVENQLSDIRQQYQDKVIFATIPPASLAKFARVKNNIDSLPSQLEAKLADSQQRLINDIFVLNDWIRQNNIENQCTNLDLNNYNTSKSLKKSPNGGKYRIETFSDKNMYDGLHANMTLKGKWHKRTTDVIYQEISKRFL